MIPDSFAKRLISRNALLIEAAALCLCAMPAMAAVVDGPATNVNVPATIDGVYLNLITGANGTTAASAPGWDLNPFLGGGVLRFFWPSSPANSFGAVSAATGGPYLVLAPGATVSSASTFSVVTTAGTAGTAFISAGNNYLGFRFFNETTSAINYGYARVQTGASGGFPATIVCYRYEDTGAPITVAACGPPVDTAPTLTYTPTTAAGVTFPSGAPGSASATIAITSTGAASAGQSAVTGCAITGPGAASFGAVTTTPSDGIFNTTTTTGSINLSCTRGATAATATLACTETATPTVAGSPFTRSWALTCPQGVVTDVAPVAAVAATTLTGGTGSVTPSITTPAQGTGSTVFACSIPATAPSNFTITGNATQTITTGTPLAIGLSCAPQVAASTATLTCTQTATPGPNPADATATITCPAASSAVSAGTVSGTTVTLPRVTLPASSSSAALSFTATGGPAVVTCTATGAGFSVAPSPLNLAAGVAGTVTVSYSGSTVGTFTGSLSCTTSGTGGPFTYPLSVTVGTPAVARTVPTMGAIGTWILVLSVLGLGMLFGARARS